MAINIQIKPPKWPRELTFEEFKKLNPHVKNENQLIKFYNQYHTKFLEELFKQKLHFKESHKKNLQTNLNELKRTVPELINKLIGDNDGVGGGFMIRKGIGFYSIGVHLTEHKEHSHVPVDEGFLRFTVGRPIGNLGQPGVSDAPPRGLPGALASAGYNAWLVDIGHPTPNVHPS